MKKKLGCLLPKVAVVVVSRPLTKRIIIRMFNANNLDRSQQRSLCNCVRMGLYAPTGLQSEGVTRQGCAGTGKLETGRRSDS